MNDPDQDDNFPFHSEETTARSSRRADGLDDAWTDDEFTTDEDRPTIERGAAFVSLAFISAALKRSAWLWCATALFGMIIGYAAVREVPARL